MTANGTLLQPSRPATTLDVALTGGASPLAAGDVRAAHAAIAPGLLFYALLAAEAAASVDVGAALRAADLWPRPPAGAAYLVWQWNTSACATPGSPVADCARPRAGGGGRVPAPPPPPPDAVPWALWQAAPVLSGGWALLGETAKYVAAAPARVRRVDAAADGIHVALAGAPGETLRVSYVRPGSGGGVIAVAALTLGADGTLEAALT